MVYDFCTSPDRVLLFMDILGFSNLILTNDAMSIESRKGKLTLDYARFADYIEDFYSSDDTMKILWMSDSFMISSDIDHVNDVMNCFFALHHDMITSGLPLRGAICVGNLYHEHNIWGEALVRAAELEKNKCIFPRIIISENDLSRLPINDSYRPYIKDTHDIKGYDYLDAMAFDFDDTLSRAEKQDNIGMSALIHVLSEWVAENLSASQGNEKIRLKWRWLAENLISTMNQRRSKIEALLSWEQLGGTPALTFDEYQEPLMSLIKRNANLQP